MSKIFNPKIDYTNPITLNLVLCMPFTEGTGTPKDLTRDCLSASLVNTPTWVFNGADTEMNFVSASDQYINLGNPTKLQITGNMTIATSYYLNSAPAVNQEFQLVAKDKDSGGRAYTLDIANRAVDSGAGLRFYVNGFGGPVENIIPVIGDSANVVATYTTGTGSISIYKGGNTYTGTGNGSLPSATANVLIGRREYAGYTQPFDGKIRYVYIWNRKLTSTEAASINTDPYQFLVNPNIGNKYRNISVGDGMSRSEGAT